VGSLYACWLGCDLESRGIETRIPAWITDFSLLRVQVRYGTSQVPYSKNSGGTAAGSPRSSTRLGMRWLSTSSSIRLYVQCMINTSDTPLRIGVCLWPSRMTAFALLPRGNALRLYSEGAGTLMFQTGFLGFSLGFRLAHVFSTVWIIIN